MTKSCISCTSATRWTIVNSKTYVVCNNTDRIPPRNHDTPDFPPEKDTTIPWTKSFQDMPCWTGKDPIQCAHPDCKFKTYPGELTEVTIDGVNVLFCGICAQEVTSWRTGT